MYLDSDGQFTLELFQTHDPANPLTYELIPKQRWNLTGLIENEEAFPADLFTFTASTTGLGLTIIDTSEVSWYKFQIKASSKFSEAYSNEIYLQVICTDR